MDFSFTGGCRAFCSPDIDLPRKLNKVRKNSEALFKYSPFFPLTYKFKVNMSLIKKINYKEVESARFGKYNLADNSTTLIYRFGNTVIDTGPPNQWKAVKNYLSKNIFQT